MRPEKIVLDTNIWVSYFIKARFDDLVNLIVDNELIVLTSVELIIELREVLGRKKFAKYLSLPVERYVDFHRELVEEVRVRPLYTASPDPKDNFLFDLVLQKQAGHLVTGDKKLLALKQVKNVDIISLTAFKALLES